MNIFRQTKHFKQFFIIDDDMYIRECTIIIDFRGEDYEDIKIKWVMIKDGKQKNLSKKRSDALEDEFNSILNEYDQQINN